MNLIRLRFPIHFSKFQYLFNLASNNLSSALKLKRALKYLIPSLVYFKV